MAYVAMDASALPTYPEAGADPAASENVTDYESSTYVAPSQVLQPGQLTSTSASTTTSAPSMSTGLLVAAAIVAGIVLLEKH